MPIHTTIHRPLRLPSYPSSRRLGKGWLFPIRRHPLRRARIHCQPMAAPVHHQAAARRTLATRMLHRQAPTRPMPRMCHQSAPTRHRPARMRSRIRPFSRRSNVSAGARMRQQMPTRTSTRSQSSPACQSSFTASRLLPHPMRRHPAPAPNHPAPTLNQPAPTPRPTLNHPAPTPKQPAPMLKPPAPTLTQPAPTLKPPPPSLTQPAPTLTHPAPALNQRALICTPHR